VEAAESFVKNWKKYSPMKKPALLHGDLWGGNYTIDKMATPPFTIPLLLRQPRMDLAMSLLFGGFDNSIYNCYDEVYPLERAAYPHRLMPVIPFAGSPGAVGGR